MRLQALEARVLNLVEAVTVRRQRIEDALVEAKAEWPSDPRRCARQIAGHANASGGDPVLWLIGLDEDAFKVRTPAPTELQHWWSKIERCFSEIAPEMQSLIVHIPSGDAVTALLFDTSRSPYVVTTEGRGVEREIPWREGNSTRSARRSEILRSVVAEAQTPRMELIDAALRFTRESSHPQGWKMQQEDPEGCVERLRVWGRAHLYVEASDSVTLPEHKWTAELTVSGTDLGTLRMSAQGPQRPAGLAQSGLTRYEQVGAIVYTHGSGLFIGGSEAVTITVDGAAPLERLDTVMNCKRATLTLRFPLALSSRASAVEVELHRSAKPEPTDDDAYRGGAPSGISYLTHDGGPVPSEVR